jgi:hypothetical protein
MIGKQINNIIYLKEELKWERKYFNLLERVMIT